MDFIPHSALGPRQIYSYPWQALIRDLERDFAESSRILAVSFLSPLRETARGQGWDITSHTWRKRKWIDSHTAHRHSHTHTQTHIPGIIPDISCWDHWVAMPCHITASWLQWLLGYHATLDQQSQLVPLSASLEYIWYYNFTFCLKISLEPSGIQQWLPFKGPISCFFGVSFTYAAAEFELKNRVKTNKNATFVFLQNIKEN